MPCTISVMCDVQVSILLHTALDRAIATDDDAVCSAIESIIMPALSCLQPDIKDATLSTVLQLEFAERPEWAVGLLRADARQGCMLFSNVSKMALAVSQLVAACEPGATDWTIVIKIVTVVSSAVSGTEHMPAAVKQKWLARLAKVCASFLALFSDHFVLGPTSRSLSTWRHTQLLNHCSMFSPETSPGEMILPEFKQNPPDIIDNTRCHSQHWQVSKTIRACRMRTW